MIMNSGDLTLSLDQARRLAVRSQHLAGPRPASGLDGMRQVLRGLRVLQVDPVNVVARNQFLVLWSRLGGFDRAGLDTLLWRERWLFEYWAHSASIVLMEDYPIHQLMMRAYRVTVESDVQQSWLAANDDFRRYVLDLVRDSGPLPGEAIEDRAAVGWVSTGWTHGRNVERMLDILWKQGDIMVAGRNGPRRLWGLADSGGSTGTCSPGSTRTGCRAPRCCRPSTTSSATGTGPNACGASPTATRCTFPSPRGSTGTT